MTRATFWRAWSIWAITIAITTTAISYDALHPLPASLADQGGNGLGARAAQYAPRPA